MRTLARGSFFKNGAGIMDRSPTPLNPDTGMASGEFTLTGELKNRALENGYREAVWPTDIRRIGVICAISGGVFLLAGSGTVLDLGLTPVVLLLTGLRLGAALIGVFCLLASRRRHNLRRFPIYLFCFIMFVGGFESIEAVLTYQPELEYNMPFTLLIIFLLFLLFPLSLKPLLTVGLITTALYVGGLRLFILPSFVRLIQLTLFFLAANGLGGYVFIQLAKSSRRQYLAMRSIESLNQKLQVEIEEKEEINRRLKQLNATDPLTGVANRRRFMDVLTSEYQRFRRYRTVFSLLMLDIDFFKRINDTHGHDCGDLVLQEVTRRIEAHLRETDLLSRIGGEEFTVILPETRVGEAMEIAERLRRTISAREISIGKDTVEITVSIGAAESVVVPDDSVLNLIKYADLALFDAKNWGRNRCVEFDRQRHARR